MLNTGTIIFISFFYMGLLFAIAYWGDKRADEGRSVIANPYIYTLSLAVYCTAWTFYGSVGMAADSGLTFLTIYIGPTLMSILGWVVLRKIIRISKVHRITSIADFIASRYGKSPMLGGAVTIIAVMGVIPYIALQLKAVSTGFLLINQYPELIVSLHSSDIPIFGDTAFYVAVTLALFAILFGTRHLEATERHEGLVAAIAFESIVKLAAFLTVGIFVTYFLHDGFADLFQKVANLPELALLLESGDQARADGKLTVAKNAYQEASLLDPSHQRAAASLSTIKTEITDSVFRRHMSNGYASLDNNNFASATDAFNQAGSVYPGATALGLDAS